MSGQRQIKELNWLGKAVFFAGQSVQFTADLIDSVVDVAVEAYTEAERAFKQGLDPRIDEANILEERSHEELRNDVD
ncbi:MAG: hypothetical protein ACC655_04325 [Rhodothermia bacterium]